MPISAPLRILAAVAVVAPIATACSPYEPAAPGPGPQPAIWTGVEHAPGAGQSHGQAEPAVAVVGEKVVSELKTPDGVSVATAEIVFAQGFATVNVKTNQPGLLAPGFHGLHIHSVGKCEPNSVAPTGGAPGDFLSAGGHFQSPSRPAHPSSGDLPSLFVRADGSGSLIATSDAFTAEELLAGSKTAIIIHEKADNFGNIPADRYQQITGGAPGPDEATMGTGDSGKRLACGVLTAG